MTSETTVRSATKLEVIARPFSPSRESYARARHARKRRTNLNQFNAQTTLLFHRIRPSLLGCFSLVREKDQPLLDALAIGHDSGTIGEFFAEGSRLRRVIGADALLGVAQVSEDSCPPGREYGKGSFAVDRVVP